MIKLETIKKHPVAIKAWLMLIKPLKIIGWSFLTIICIYLPVYFAQIYESSIYSLGQMSSIEASHYTQMITFGYNVASITTVLLGYFLIKHLWFTITDKNAIKKMIIKYPEAEKYLCKDKKKIKK